jgi:AraC family transcriptional activator of tynA and feaB
LDLVTLALRHAIGAEIAARSPSAEIALARLKTAIEQRLTDPGLIPATAAAASGIGVRYANQLLAAEGASLERYITQRRLCRCAETLDDPQQSGRRIGEIAYAFGFANASHFGRCFKERYGLTPRDYRAAARQRQP